MERCWQEKPLDRPGFIEMRKQLDTMLEVKEEYLELINDVNVKEKHCDDIH